MSHCENYSQQTDVNLLNVCNCERQSEDKRIACLVEAYARFMKIRQKPLYESQYNSLLNSHKLSHINLFASETQSVLEECAESQILLSFYNNYIRTHPKLLKDGPLLTDIKPKSDFFSAA